MPGNKKPRVGGADECESESEYEESSVGSKDFDKVIWLFINKNT